MSWLPVVDFIENLGILAVCAIAVVHLRRATSSWGAAGSSAFLGVVFGLCAVATMFAPIEVAPGLIFDTRSGPILIAGPVAGPWAAVVAAGIAAAARLGIGGVGAVPGALALVVCGAASVAWALWMRRSGTVSLGIGRSMVVAVAMTVISLPAILLLPFDLLVKIIATAVPLLFVGNALGTLALAILIDSDLRRERLEEELVGRAREARAASEAKIRFLATMSHEIRTPMNGVLGYLDLMLAQPMDGYLKRCAEQARSAGGGLVQIIDDILDYARIEATGVQINARPIDLERALRASIGVLEPMADAKRLALETRLAGDLRGGALLDPLRLRQVVVNIVGNAIKYTHEGRVTVEASIREGDDARWTLQLIVMDTGRGMTEIEIDRLFEPFERGDSIGIEGSGLGMVVTRALVEGMEGQLEVESAKGLGTKVTVTIPFEATDLPAPETRPEGQRSPAPAKLRSLRILVAEDNALNAELLEALLRQGGHEVRIVGDGEAAYQAVAGSGPDSPFDLVLMDVQMPVLDGIEATRRIRGLPVGQRDVPIIGLTAFAGAADRESGIAAGMTEYLTKPVQTPALFATLIDLFGEDAPAADRPAEATALEFDPSKAEILVQTLGIVRAESFVDELLDKTTEHLSALKIDAVSAEAVHRRLHDLVAAAGNLGFTDICHEARILMAGIRSEGESGWEAQLEAYRDRWSRALPSLKDKLTDAIERMQRKAS